MNTTQKRPKILYLITKGTYGGAQRYVLDLATNFQKKQYDVAVAYGMPGLLVEKLRGAGIRTIAVPTLSRDIHFGKELRALYELYRLIKSERPDILHLNSSKAAGLGALAARFCLLRIKPARLQPDRVILAGNDSSRSGGDKGLRIIFTVHGWPFNEPRNMLARAGIWLASYLTALLSNRVITLCRADEKSARRMPGIGKKTCLIQNGIEPVALLPRKEARQRLSFKISDNATVVGTIAELNRNKGIDTLIEAAALLPQHITALIIGDGEERTKLEALSAARGVSHRVHFCGFVPNASEYLLAFDIFVLPSRKEGLPYALLEAGAAGIPVVGSDIPGIRDIIKDAAVGVLVPPQNPVALATALASLCKSSEKRERLQDALAVHIKKYFSQAGMLEKTLALYA